MRVLAAVLVLFALIQKGAPTHVVTDAVTQRSVAFARLLFVRTEGRLVESVLIEADDRGRFSTTDLPVGTYRVVAEQDGYLRGSWPQPVSIVPGQTAGVITIALTPTAVITGRVLAEDGQPASKIFVRAHAMTAAGPATDGNVQSVTNDLGEFRLFDLAPGTYAVSAEPYPGPSIGTVELPSGRPAPGLQYIVPTPPCADCRGEGRSMRALSGLLAAGDFIDPGALSKVTYPRVYFPGTVDAAQAKGVILGPGSRVDGIDLRLVVAKF